MLLVTQRRDCAHLPERGPGNDVGPYGASDVGQTGRLHEPAHRDVDHLLQQKGRLRMECMRRDGTIRWKGKEGGNFNNLRYRYLLNKRINK